MIYMRESACMFIGIYGISIIVRYFMPSPFYTYKQFYFKQFSLV